MSKQYVDKLPTRPGVPPTPPTMTDKNLKQQVYDIVKRELTREYPWTQDPEKLSKAMEAVKKTLEGSRTCALTVSFNVAWKEIGMKGKPTYKGLHALPGQIEQPPTLESKAETSPEQLADLLSLVSVEVTVQAVEQWPQTYRDEAEKWAAKAIARANDNPVRVPPKPAWLCWEPLTVESAIPRRTSIINREHPEWGTWGIMEHKGDWYEIANERGGKILFPSEFKFWAVVVR